MAAPRTIANLGDGVKTADIADDAVTTAKIVDGAITAAKLATGATNVAGYAIATHATEFSTTSTSFVDTDLEVAYTPVASGNKIWAIATCHAQAVRTSGTAQGMEAQLTWRGSSLGVTGFQNNDNTGGAGNSDAMLSVSGTAAAGSGANTLKLQIKADSGQTAKAMLSNATGTIIIVEFLV